MNSTTKDPFESVDMGHQPTIEESILIDRVESNYYQPIVKWFFDCCRDYASLESVLEVGSGTGHLLKTLADESELKNKSFHGVDRSNFLVERAAKRFPELDFAYADGRSLPFNNDRFSLAYIATVLVHTEDPQAIVREMARVVRPGGIVALLDQDFETATLHPGHRHQTRRVLNAACDFWQNGWVGRKLPMLLQKADLEVIYVNAKVRIDTKFDPSFFRRIHDWIIEGGFPEDEANAWYNELCTTANVEGFFFSRNFYCVLGRVK